MVYLSTEDKKKKGTNAYSRAGAMVVVRAFDREAGVDGMRNGKEDIER